MHPFVVALLYLGAPCAWAAWWYTAALLGEGLVVAAPTHLKRPAARGTATLALLVADMADAPVQAGRAGPRLILKLVAHVVPEAPYQPRAGR